MKSVFYSNGVNNRLALVFFADRSGLKKLLLVVVAMGLLMGTGTSQDYISLGTMGTPGSGPGQFNHPKGIAVDPDNTIYIVDYQNHRVQVFNPDGIFIRQFGTDGSGNDQFHYPTCVETDADGNVYVGDYYGVKVFDSDGTFLRKRSVTYVSGIALDDDGNVYVSTSFEISIFNNALTQEIRSFGTNGSGNGQFDNARSIKVDKTGRIFVADLFNDRVQVFNNDGTYLAQFGSAGTGDGQFTSVTGIAIDGSGYIYTTDEGDGRLQVFHPETFAFVKKFGSRGSAEGQFDGPQEIELDKAGHIFIVEYWNNRMQILRKPLNTIDITDNITKTYEDDDFTLTATSESQGTVQFSKLEDGSTTGDVTITGNTVSIVKAGVVKILAYVPDTYNYAAGMKVITLTINKAAQTITFDPLEPLIEGQTGFTLTASSTSTLPVTFDSNNPGVATVEGDVVTIKGVGTATITSYQDGNENYEAAPVVQRQLVVEAITGVHPQVEAITEVYPVPSHDLVNIRSRLVTPSTRVVILDSSGHRMEELTPSAVEENRLQVSVKHLPAGMYYLQLSGASTITQRIVKN